MELQASDCRSCQRARARGPAVTAGDGGARRRCVPIADADVLLSISIEVQAPARAPGLAKEPGRAGGDGDDGGVRNRQR